jgi:2-keto-4-pentenoate hydratase/2-oxohepta-3-ene-1,7-dioic acid hydratase in catechol pathway
LSYYIGRRVWNGLTLPCLVAGDGVVRDASKYVLDWSGENLDPEFLESIEMQFRVLPDAFPALAGRVHDIALPFAGGRNLICAGLNFPDHAAEARMAGNPEPVVYLKPFYTLTPSPSEIIIPEGCRSVSWEGELAVVIGRHAYRLPDTHHAAGCIAGYTTSNDVGDLDWMLNRGGQWVKGKAFPGFNPVGTWLLVGRDRHPLGSTTITTTVNGRVAQHAAVSDMIFGPARLVWYISQFLQLVPGDVINCGTPAGTALDGSGYLRPGDEVTVTIAEVGSQSDTFVSAPAGEHTEENTDALHHR